MSCLHNLFWVSPHFFLLFFFFLHCSIQIAHVAMGKWQNIDLMVGATCVAGNILSPRLFFVFSIPIPQRSYRSLLRRFPWYSTWVVHRAKWRNSKVLEQTLLSVSIQTWPHMYKSAKEWKNRWKTEYLHIKGIHFHPTALINTNSGRTWNSAWSQVCSFTTCIC